MPRDIEDGGQAFPQPFAVGPNDDLYPAYPGMSLRDYFAAKALGPIITHIYSRHGSRREGVRSEALVAEQAYAFADAMLEARSK